MGRLEKSVAVVTGATGGLGRAIATVFAKEGADVVVTARHEERLAEVAKEVESRGRKALAFHGDISRWETAEALAKSAIEAFGKVDVLVNNAVGWAYGPLHELDVRSIEETIDTTVKGTVWVTKAFLPYMLRRGRGCIISIASAAVRGQSSQKEGSAPYLASKSAVVTFSDALRKEVGPKGIRVATILPGPFAGDEQDEYLAAVGAQVERRAMRIIDVVEAIVITAALPPSAGVDELMISAL